MEMGLKKIINEQVTGGSGGPGKTGKTGGGPGKTGGGPGKTGGGPGKTGAGRNTGGNTGAGVTPTVTQQPAVTPVVTVSPPPVTPPIQKQAPLPEPGPKKDVNFCKCWTEGNYFDEDFSKEERNSMANKFYSFASRQKISKGTFDRVEANVASKNCGDSNCLFYQNPTIRELARAQVATSNLTNTQNLYEVWKETIDQKKAAEAKQAEPEPEKSTIGYSNLSDPSDFFSSAQNTVLFKTNKNDFSTNWRDLKTLYDSSVIVDRKNCGKNLELYLDLFKRRIGYSFGDPKTSDEEDYDVRKKYWYGFLNILLTIKRNLKRCRETKLDSNLSNSLAAIPDTDTWNFNIFKDGNSKTDSNAITLAKQNLATEQSVIRKKLIEYKEMKTLKESVRNKILLTKENKDKKVNKISENLYKIAGDFYNDRYDVFFNKYVRLKESYEKSKMFLMEGASDNFQNALTRVFKGDEEQLVNEAISWFINKLGLEGSVKTQVEEKLRSKYSGDSVANLFEDDWSDIVVAAVRDNAKSDVSEPSNVMDAVEKVMMSKLDTSDFDYQLKKIISNMIRPAQDEKKDKIQTLADQLKSSILNSES